MRIYLDIWFKLFGLHWPFMGCELLMITWSWMITWSLKNGMKRQRPWSLKRRIWFLWFPAKIIFKIFRDHRILCSEKNTALLFNYPQPRKTKTNILVFKTTLVIVYLIITRKDTFYLRNTADAGKITAIAIKRDESGWFPKWQLARVSRELYMSKF